MRHAFLRMQWR